ncbi:MAG TPA: glycine betaine ABC transporter substrate-binding protein [Candidatus Angelobacter sp.]|nr:glycine betaine ABC transporter substrate-binding protein [Candidatus Angelobacter sp.]
MDRRHFLAGTALLLAGCSTRRSGTSIGCKNFTEQLVLGELLAQYLARFISVPIEKRFYLAGTYICHQALLAGRIDMYVEYTGTALVAILKEPPSSDHAAVFDAVREKYASRFNIEALPSLGFDNTFAMVMRGNDARRLGLKTLSDAAAIASQLRLGVGYEFLERPDGYKGLIAKYGFNFREAPRVMDLGLLYRALQNNQVDLVAGSNTDGLIAALDLVVLEDDRRYFPPYDAVPLVRQETLRRYPEVGAALRRLSGRITADEMRRMNFAVDGEKKDAAAVVKAFIESRLNP